MSALTDYYRAHTPLYHVAGAFLVVGGGAGIGWVGHLLLGWSFDGDWFSWTFSAVCGYSVYVILSVLDERWRKRRDRTR